MAVPGARARVARAGRIYVEGRHDAELVEKVWGDDLRVEGVVVEYLEGIDDLPAIVTEFAPGPDARLGILVDHLVPGTKEFRIARSVTSEHALVVGHPYIDVWEAVKPASLGIPGWPRIPHGQDWKTGVCRELGWPENTGAVWRAILARVRSYRDLEPELLGRVEELIDFVTAPPSSPSGRSPLWGSLRTRPVQGRQRGSGGGSPQERDGTGRGGGGENRPPQSTRSRTTASASNRPRNVNTARPSP